MKLQFRILWIDDDWINPTTKADLERQKISISQYLRGNYFLEEFKINTGDLDITKKFPDESEEFDLFIVDFNIGSKKGFEYIEWIRGHSLYTDIIFYSSDPKIEHKVMDYLNQKTQSGEYTNKFLQGVFISTRSDLSIKFQELLDIIDNKVNNLYSMRGLVLAETADLDYILCEIIDKLCDRYSICKKSYSLGRDGSKTCPDDSTSEKFISWIQSKDGGSNDNLIYNLTNKSSPRGLSTHTGAIHTNLSDYRYFYATKRNNLAHGKTQPNPDGTMSANGEKYTISNLKDMRKQLLDFRTCFEKFRESI